MSPTSTNGFTFSASIDKAGAQITLVAHKDDHERRVTEVFHLSPEQARELASLLSGSIVTAKERRKAIRRAAKQPDSSSLT